MATDTGTVFIIPAHEDDEQRGDMKVAVVFGDGNLYNVYAEWGGNLVLPHDYYQDENRIETEGELFADWVASNAESIVEEAYASLDAEPVDTDYEVVP